MSDDPTTERLARADRSGNGKVIPVTVAASLLSAVLAGGGGSYLTGRDMSQTMREGQIRLEAQVTQLREDVRRIGDDQRAGLARLEQRDAQLDDRLRMVEREVWAGARPTSGPR
jgi:hypothetical protein